MRGFGGMQVWKGIKCLSNYESKGFFPSIFIKCAIEG